MRYKQSQQKAKESIPREREQHSYNKKTNSCSHPTNGCLVQRSCHIFQGLRLHLLVLQLGSFLVNE